MKLFRRDPGNRRPDDARETGVPAPTAAAPEAPHPAAAAAPAEASDDDTIATLISLFREDEDTPPTETREATAPRADAPHSAPQTEPAAPHPALRHGADRADPAPRTPEPVAEPAPEPDLSAPLLLKDRAPQDVPAPHHAAPHHADLQHPAPQHPRPAEAAPPPAAEVPPAAPDEAIVDLPLAAGGRPARRGGRVKTRLLGFEQSHAGTDPFARAQGEAAAGPAAQTRFPVGWIVVLKGPGRGACFTLYSGVSQIGRGEDQTVRLDFGDSSISRQGHAVLAYDPELRRHFVGHGGKANIVRLNDMPVLSTEELRNGDRIRLGETTLRFVALCGAEFDWDADGEAAGDEYTAE